MALPPVDLLLCPDCLVPLQGSPPPEVAVCTRCDRHFSVEKGVFDLAPREVKRLTDRTVRQFGASWQIHDHLADYQERQFLDWIAPLGPSDFAGKDVLEAGCGKGRHTLLMAGYGARRLVSVDLSDAVVVAAHHTRECGNASIVRADLLRLPLSDASVDVAVCLGVLHHLEHPEAGLGQLWRALRPGGTLCLWVYGREGNAWIVRLVDPVRKHLTSRIPTGLLRPLLWPLAGMLYLLLKLVYGPMTSRGRWPVGWLPYSAYLGYISHFPFREVEHIVLDHLCPPVAYYLSKEELEAWFAKLPGAKTQFRWHNRNSWNVVARKGESG